MSPGLPRWHSAWESACQCRGHGFEPWSGKIPHATEQLGPWATTTEPARLEPVLRNKRGRDSERPAHRDEEWPPRHYQQEPPSQQPQICEQPTLCAAEVGWWLSRSMFVATVIDLMIATSLANHARSSYSNPTHLSILFAQHYLHAPVLQPCQKTFSSPNGQRGFTFPRLCSSLCLKCHSSSWVSSSFIGFPWTLNLLPPQG